VQLQGHVPRWKGCDSGVGRFSSIYKNSRALIENTLSSKAGNRNSANSELGEFASMDKYTQLLFIKRSLQSQKFDKSSNCP
jgi:hypothetical protein